MNRILFPLKPRMHGDAVADLQDGLQLLLENGVFQLSDADRKTFADRLSRERAENVYGEATGKLVGMIQTRAHTNASGEVDETTAAELNRLLAQASAAVYSVEGRVSSSARPAASGLKVTIVDKNVGEDLQLKDTVTGENGVYQASFMILDLQKRGKQRPDLQAQVFAGDKLLGSSAVRYNASNNEKDLDVILPADAADALPTEYEALTGSVSRYFTGKLADLKETDGQQDISYLANKAGWDARAVAMAALADRFSRQAGGGIPPVFFYALFRAGLPADENMLYHIDGAVLGDVWKKAAEQGVIPKDQVPAIPRMAQQFQTVSAQKLLAGPALAGISPLKDMLAASGLDDAKQKQFAALFTANRMDMEKFWSAVGQALGQDTAKKLQLYGKLGFLTINNAPLVQKLSSPAGVSGMNDPIELARQGYHRPAKWSAVLTPDVPVPSEIPGDTPEAKRAAYADYLAAQVRLSYPTASVAEIVRSEKLLGDASDPVQAFLTEQQGKFEIGAHPVEQYVRANHLQPAPETLKQLKRLQRVYQITPSDQAMTTLLKSGVDSAYAVVRYPKETFIASLADAMGGKDQAALTYDKALQVHNAVLNVAVSYLTAGTAPAIGVHSPAQIVDPAPQAANAGDIIAYATMESLMGGMDFCACGECRSILSPAAYLVDLLNFIDVPPAETGKENPQAVLLSRRPDLQHLPLTCENTNTALPYIDLVNETLEYFIANDAQKFSLQDYTGHDTDGAASEDLLASPQCVMGSAYAILRDARFPEPLPFHRPLENLRRLFEAFGVPLPLAMERLRKNDDLERPNAQEYAWRDILIEEIGISRPEHEILTDANAMPLWRIYGFPQGTAESDVIAALSNAKQFSRRVTITYEDLIAVLQTRFVNPNSDLIPKLERLGVPFAAMKALKEAPGTSGDAAFDALLHAGAAAPDPAEYNGNIKAWVKDDANYNRIMSLITLTDPTGEQNPCSFERLEFRHAKPPANATDTSTRLNAVEFVRLLRFIRLWRKTGWTIEQADAAICSLYNDDLSPLRADQIDATGKLDAGFLRLLPRLGVVRRVMNTLELNPERDLLPLLACWSEIDTHGDHSLYRSIFLNPAILNQDPVFRENGYGEYLTDAGKKLADHAESIRAAFNLTAEEYGLVTASLGYNANTPLTLPVISAIFRRGRLARALKLSVRELLLLSSFTGLDPFGRPDPPDPAILRLVSLVQAMRDRSVKSAVALYLIWNQDLSGRSAPDPAQVTELARTLKNDFATIDAELAAADPGGDPARARMTLVYGQETTDGFFALLDDSVVVDVPYTHPGQTLEPPITEVDAKLSYDPFTHRLSHTGVLTAALRDALKAVANVPDAFKQALDALFDRGEELRGLFFTRFPELKDPFDQAYAASPTDRHTVFLDRFQPELARIRKRQQALQRVSAAVNVDVPFAQTLLDATGGPYPLHAESDPARPALDDAAGLDRSGLAAEFYFRETATGNVDLSVDTADNLEYVAGSVNPLPNAGNAVSGRWHGQLEAPEAGYYNIVIETDDNATVTLTLAGQDRPLVKNGGIRRNTDPIELKGGKLYDLALTVEKVKDVLRIRWETPKRAREVIPSRYLYAPTVLARFTATYVRFLKAASLTAATEITAAELAWFATHPDYQINGDGWLNLLTVQGDPSIQTAAALLKPFRSLLDFSRIKNETGTGDEQLLSLLKDPAAANANGLFAALLRWDGGSLAALLNRFNKTVADLSHFDLFVRVYDAFSLMRKMSIAAGPFIAATTNEPDGDMVRGLQAALRARYDAAAWRELVKPINDDMRALRRDALVAYILQQMRSNANTAQIDTADKLFEYFLMDVEMEPCMQTSRIRHALSSVQLFIERCLMNLEPRVSPASVNAAQWEWMKRYRVWEANRKVFLFPENWLEPELRDDKSPFFKEIESELLQGDITEERATTAFVNYLAKLEEVAKLEPCGIYHIDADPARRTGEADHVVARTAGANRKYFYRRREYGSWTPWEQIKPEIEDNPVAPVLWNDRLLLFWLRLLKQNPDSAADAPGGTLNGGMKASDAVTPGAQKVSVRAVLCWSEYYNGKWQPARTSDVNQPVALGDFPPAGPLAFDRTALALSIEEGQESLRITIWGGQRPGAFILYNTHSLPLPTFPLLILASGKSRSFETASSDFTVDYAEQNLPGPRNIYPRIVLTDPVPDYRATAPAERVADAWPQPFLFEDRRNAFYVTTEEQPIWVRTYNGFGIAVNPGIMASAQMPPLVVQSPAPPGMREDGAGPDARTVDPARVQRFVSEDAYIHQGLGTNLNVTYGGRVIGPSGAITDGAAGR